MKFGRVSLLPLFVLSVILLSAGRPARAQTDVPPLPLSSDPVLVHLDTPAVPAKARVGAFLEVRAIGGDENLVYTSLGAQYGFGNNWSGLLRGTFAGRENFALPDGTSAVRHGGNDVELAAKYQLADDERFAGLIGVSFPGTAAQSDPVITLGASAAFALGSRATLYINPKAVLLQDNLLLGLGIGAQARISDTVSLVADVTPLLSGDNTRSTDDGDRERRSVYGVALRIARPENPLGVNIGYANGVGRTTGAALTPGLGESGGFYIGLTLRQ